MNHTKARRFVLGFLFSLNLLFHSAVGFSAIHEISSILELKAYLTPHTVVLLDIDNTLIEPQENIGGDQWFSYLFTLLALEGNDIDTTEMLSVGYWRRIRPKLHFQTVEKEGVPFLNSLVEAKIPVFGLTARGTVYLKQITFEQLQSVGIQFKESVTQGTDVTLEDYGFEKNASVSQSVIFTGNLPKGQVVDAFFKKMNYKPRQILFVDDKSKNLQSLEDVFQSRAEVAYHGFRLNRLDPKVQKFNEAVVGVKTFHDFVSFTELELAKKN